ncbi:hypothetical protein [Novosphingobium profundi]|uniref:hypothetical protein n=1 Tax=Novosphingobium profundi TaxID=1774954 RepID=UPI001FEAF97C|nr:hypothetical protein [Novosphingobium profundi]
MPARSLLSCLAIVTLPLAQPALARQDSQDKEPITKNDPSALDIAKTPVTDLNLDGKEIPAVLVKASQNPYDLTGLKSCKQISDAVQELFLVLGPDVDIPQEQRDRISAARVAKWVVSSFIPFRGLIREISGANDRERKIRAAIQAGMTRRGFLKGIGSSRGCAYPAAPATAADIVRIEAELDRVEAEHKSDDDKNQSKAGDKDDNRRRETDERQGQERTSKGVPIVNEPVVQPIG